LVDVTKKKFSNPNLFIEIIMKLKLSSVAAATLFVLSSLSIAQTAFAAPVYTTTNVPIIALTEDMDNLGQYSGSFDAVHATAGFYKDIFTFSPSFPSLFATAGAVVTSSFRFTGLKLLEGTNLNGVNLDSGSFTSFGTTFLTYGVNDVSIDGTLKLTVLSESFGGKGAGFGGSVGVSVPQTISPVPEPETYAMMLAGLGLLGFAARRKAKANQA
jgi:hypothetical protein